MSAKLSIQETKLAFTVAREQLEQAAHAAWLKRNSVAAELTAAVNAPMTVADAAPVVERALDSLAVAQNENFRRNIGGLFSANCRDDVPGEQMSVITALLNAAANSNDPEREWLAALVMPTLRANIPTVLAGLQWPEGSLSAADRAKKIAELEPRLAEADKAMQSAMADIAELIGHPWDLNQYLEKIAA